MKKLAMVMLSFAFLTPMMSHAADQMKPIDNWTCEDFLALNKSYQPTAVALITATNSKGKTEGQILDVQGVEKVTPVIIQECKKDRTLNFKNKVKNEWTKLKKHV